LDTFLKQTERLKQVAAAAAAALDKQAAQVAAAKAAAAAAAAPAAKPRHEAVLPWPPRLAQQELQRGLTYYGSGERFRALAAKLLASQPIKVFTLGGSVTFGNGATSRRQNYANRFFEFLRATFPNK
jgi:hypothetical protein